MLLSDLVNDWKVVEGWKENDKLKSGQTESGGNPRKTFQGEGQEGMEILDKVSKWKDMRIGSWMKSFQKMDN